MMKESPEQAIESTTKVWNEDSVIFIIVSDYPSFIGAQCLLSMLDESVYNEERFWQKAEAEKDFFRSFDDHAKKWGAKIVIYDPNVIRLVDEINRLASLGNQAIKDHNLSAFRSITQQGVDMKHRLLQLIDIEALHQRINNKKSQ